MKSKMLHTNINVRDLEASVAFYEKALGLHEVRRKKAADGSFILAYMGDGQSEGELELTWLRDHDRPYDLGENEWHIAYRVDDRDAAYRLHKEMGCIVYENHDMGLYFIADPDGYWVEILA